jgi:branched-chain amino acid transport system permease protein
MNTLLIEQTLNGLQFGLMLFLLAAGLTLVFGIMDMINLAHGSLYMIGAYLTAAVTQASGSYIAGIAVALVGTALIGIVLEIALLRRLYKRDHLSQVLATFALILISNESISMIWGAQPIKLNTPAVLSTPVELMQGLYFPAHRLLIIGVGLVVAFGLYFLVAKTRVGMWVRAGASNREMATTMGVNIKWLFTFVFGFGAMLCALAGAMLGPLLAVQVGMGESILILAFVVVVVGGIGSIRGAFVGSLLIGLVDTLSRTIIPSLLGHVLSPAATSALGPALASIIVYILMAAVLFWKPQGLFPARG